LNLLEQLSQEGVPSDLLIAVHSDAAALLPCPAGQRLQLERRALRFSKSDAPADLVHSIAEEQMPRFARICAGTEVTIIVAGLGGVVGTSISPVAAAAARQAGSFALCFAILPFDCEGSLRGQTAAAGLTCLQEAADLVICLPNQKVLGLVDDTTSLLDTFKSANRLIIDSLHGAFRALNSQSVMGLPFLELCAGIRQHSRLFQLAAAKAAGPNRAGQALEAILAHPMLEESTWGQLGCLGVWIAGGSGLAIAEVNRIMAEVHRKCDGCPVLMGAGIVPELDDTLLIGLLASKSDQGPDPLTDSDDGITVQPSARGNFEDLRAQLLDGAPTPRHSRFVAPPPAVPPERLAQFLKEQGRNPSRARKVTAKLRQTQLPLEIVSKGRFDKSEPTIHKGEDLDVPTYIRRGVALN